MPTASATQAAGGATRFHAKGVVKKTSSGSAHIARISSAQLHFMLCIGNHQACAYGVQILASGR